MAVATSIQKHNDPPPTHRLYTVNVGENSILTLVTHNPAVATTWIKEIHASFQSPKATVGIDIEWRPMLTSKEYHPVATLQICVGDRCLIYQILHAGIPIPESLVDFLYSPSYTFVGVGIKDDIQKLETDYQLGIGGMVVDLANLAADRYGETKLRNAGLKTLARRVLGLEIVKSMEVTLSWWDSLVLTDEQVQYACIDAFVSFEIGRVLNASSLNDS